MDLIIHSKMKLTVRFSIPTCECWSDLGNPGTLPAGWEISFCQLFEAWPIKRGNVSRIHRQLQ